MVYRELIEGKRKRVTPPVMFLGPTSVQLAKFLEGECGFLGKQLLRKEVSSCRPGAYLKVELDRTDASNGHCAIAPVAPVSSEGGSQYA
jgi:hypothetical protein